MIIFSVCSEAFTFQLSGDNFIPLTSNRQGQNKGLYENYWDGEGGIKKSFPH